MENCERQKKEKVNETISVKVRREYVILVRTSVQHKSEGLQEL